MPLIIFFVHIQITMKASDEFTWILVLMAFNLVMEKNLLLQNKCNSFSGDKNKSIPIGYQSDDENFDSIAFCVFYLNEGRQCWHVIDEIICILYWVNRGFGNILSSHSRPENSHNLPLASDGGEKLCRIISKRTDVW